MTKNLRYSFILFSILSLVVVAWGTLTSFFNGVGVNFAVLLVVIALLILLMFTDEYTKNRTKDMLWISIAFVVLEFLIYFIFEFNIGNYKVWKVFYVFQNIYSILGLIFFAYIVFRLICEVKDVKFGIIEAMLGNNKVAQKIKKDKEVSKGSLEEKPNKNQEKTYSQNINHNSFESNDEN